MALMIAHLSTHMEPVPVRHLTLTRIEPREAAPQDALTRLLDLFGVDGVETLLDYVDYVGTRELRRRIATLLAVKGGR